MNGVFASLSSFISCWKEECSKTEQLFNAIPADLWHKEVIPNYRTLARLGWHIVQTPVEMLERVGLHITGPKPDAPLPQKSHTIIENHKKVCASVAEQIGAKWTDNTLAQVDDMYGERWTRSLTLTALLHHLIHHRGQMTVLLRAEGHHVPGLYGPAKEEWANYGMAAPEI